MKLKLFTFNEPKVHFKHDITAKKTMNKVHKIVGFFCFFLVFVLYCVWILL